MKNIIFFIAFIIGILPCIMQGQDKDKQVGVRGGFITGDISNDLGSLYETNNKDFYLGFFYEKEVARLLKFSSGLEYMQIGASSNDDNQVKISYLVLPLGLKFNLANFFVKGGGSILMRIYTKEVINGQEMDPPIYDYNSTPIAVFIGGGMRFAMLEFEIRYNKGISDAIPDYTAQYWQFGINFFIR